MKIETSVLDALSNYWYDNYADFINQFAMNMGFFCVEIGR